MSIDKNRLISEPQIEWPLLTDHWIATAVQRPYRRDGDQYGRVLVAVRSSKRDRIGSLDIRPASYVASDPWHNPLWMPLPRGPVLPKVGR